MSTTPAADGDQTNYAWLKAYPASVNWHTNFPAKRLGELLSQSVARFPDRPLTNFLGKVLTFQDISEMVDKTAAGLQAQGVKKGTKVGLFLPNCPTFIIYYYATLKAGGTVVNFNPLYTIEELSYQIEDSETEFMVTLDLQLLFEKVETLVKSGVLKKTIVCSFTALLPSVKSVLFKLAKSKELARIASSPVRDKVILESDLLDGAGQFSPVTVDPLNDIAVLQYTGGTTGKPKGAMLTHYNLYVNVHQVGVWAPELVDGHERVFGVLPFFHVFAMTVVMNFAVYKGAEIVIMPRFVLDDALKLLHKTRPTVMPGVPTLYTAMLNHPKLKSYDLSSLKFCLSGGAPLPLEIKKKFESLTGCKLVEGYGLSETSPVATCNPIEGQVKDGKIGMPVPATVVSLRDLEDATKEVPQGERGEICIKGPQVMAGYWKRPDATREQFVGDFLRTGDVAIMDEDGWFEIVDRTKDLIICSGYNVYPRNVEEAIYKHPAVEEVTVIGIPDQYRGEAPKAFIKLKSGRSADSDEILTFLKEKLSKIELPSEIEFRDELPKTMIGKLSKKELKAEEAEKRKASQV